MFASHFNWREYLSITHINKFIILLWFVTKFCLYLWKVIWLLAYRQFVEDTGFISGRLVIYFSHDLWWAINLQQFYKPPEVVVFMYFLHSKFLLFMHEKVSMIHNPLRQIGSWLLSASLILFPLVIDSLFTSHLYSATIYEISPSDYCCSYILNWFPYVLL